MSDKIIHLNEELIKHDLRDLVRSSVEETLNALLDTIIFGNNHMKATKKIHR